MTGHHPTVLGRRLRAIRLRQGLTLEQVDARSHREFTQAAVGAYERGDRIITVPRLQRLAELYGVPLHDLLPLGRPEGSAEDAIDLRAVPLAELAGELTHIERLLADLTIEVQALRIRLGVPNR